MTTVFFGITIAVRRSQRLFFIASCKNCIYNLLMITYDESKRLLNLKKHYLDFIGCEAVFAGITLTREDKCENYGEMRFQTLGLWHDIVVFIVHTPRGEHEHIISIRKAEKHEQRIYWQHYNG
jgi:uncharacterized DUF497 family protein